MSITKADKKADPLLKRVFYIHYPMCFKKDQTKIQVMIDSRSKVNSMTPAYVAKLGFKVRLTNIGAQKIDGSTI